MDRSPQTSALQDTGKVLEEINGELAALARRTDELRKKMSSLHYWNDPVGNRRLQRQDRRVHEERRRIVRLDGDRRTTRSDRRLPLEERSRALETELAMVSQRSRELVDMTRRLSMQA